MTEQRKKLSTFRRGFVSTFVLDLLGRGFSALATVFFIRALGTSSFAYLVLFLNIGQFAGAALTGGIRMRYMRTEAERVSRGDEEATGFGLAIAASLLLVLAIGTLAIAGVAIAGGAGVGSSLLFVALTAAYTAGYAVVELGVYHHQAHLSFARAGWIGVGRGGALIVVGIAALAGFVDAGAVTAAAVAGATCLVGAIVCVPLLRSGAGSLFGAGVSREFGRESGWLTLYYLASAGFAYADIFIVAGFLNDDAVASYGAALRYIAIVMGPLPSLLAVMRVRTSQSDLIDSAAAQVHMLRNWMRQSILPVSALIGIAAVAAPFAIPLVDGGRYPDSVPIFEFMLVPALINYATLPSSGLLMSQKRYPLLAAIYTALLAIQLIAAGGIATVAGVVAVAAVACGVGAIEPVVVAIVAGRLARRAASEPAPAA
ncbi:MAG: hypothetical protein JSS68_17030 [Actinobacteria bacterium]|nr:hypothetical protein [Actinomycetota bacterium]